MRRDVFQAIADPVRRDIIELLAKEVLTVNHIAERFTISRPAISKHLRILNECEIITFKKEGRERFCHIQADKLLPAYVWIDKYKQLWDNRIDAFEDYLKTIENTENE